MVTYKFKLIDSKVPVVRGRKVITDSNVGGIKNTYKVYAVLLIQLIVKNHTLLSFRIPYKHLGTKSFLRPYQSVWDKYEHRLPGPYWGKGPLLNLWILLGNNYDNYDDVKVLLMEHDTKSHTIEILNIEFKSHEIKNNLNLNHTFYQSKFTRNGNKNKNRQQKG